MRPHHAHHIPPTAVPRNDDGYFEALTRCVFQAGIDWGLIRERWPAFREAFAGFSVPKVARFGTDDLDRLLDDKGIVRNYRKIAATLSNAATMLEVKREFGSFKKYLRSLDGRDYRGRVKDLKQRFRHLGDTGAFIFLYTVGEDVPEWEERRM